MKNRFFPLIKKVLPALRGMSGRPLVIWLLVHGGLLLALGLSAALAGPVRFNASLFDILPPSRGLKDAAPAEAVLRERSGRQIVILAGSADFALSKTGAVELYNALYSGAENSSHDFESLALWVDQSYLNRLRDYLYDYRFMLLNHADRELLENGGAAELASAALSSVYGAFGFASLDNFEGDPFLLAERNMRGMLASSLISGGNIFPRDDVLAAQYGGSWYVMLRGSLAPAGVALTNRGSAIEKMYAAGEKITAENPGLRFYYSGVPFHSYESSSTAQREISLISTVSLMAILVIFLYVFRSPVPVLASVAAAGCSILTALCAALLFFREVHVLSFVFGTTLIGTCVDYSIHYFIHRKGMASFLNGVQIRSIVFKGIVLSFVSTVICFAVLLFAPFIILKQFAVFSVAGLLSSFLSVMCVYPLIWNGKSLLEARRRGHKKAGFLDRGFFLLGAIPYRLKKKLKIFFLLSILLALIIIIAVNHNRIRIENSLGGLYNMPQSLAESERINALAVNHGSMGWYFIVSGSTPEEALQKEEVLCAALDGEIAAGTLGSYLAASLFIPSRKTQEESFRAAEKLLPLAEAQFMNTGFPSGAAEYYRREFAASLRRYVLPGGENFPADLAASLWIGPAGGKYFSSVMPLHAKDEAPFRAIAATMDGVYFVNNVKDTAAELDRLTGIMFILFISAFVLIVIVARCFYPWERVMRICAVPLALVLTVLVVLSMLDISLGFFTVAGLLLVFGLGLDYIFYSLEAEKKEDGGLGRRLTAEAIFLSFGTTALSFGTLALSSFQPVHIFGITVFAGICAAYITALLVTPDVK
ncbi:MAG: MMPL family transporter [Treponema sp.]|nr:MMPL family transporter [Treponema sp.]